MHVCVYCCVFVTQAFIIGWTSDLIPKILYQVQSVDDSLTGYVNSSLSVFNTANLTQDMRPDSDLYNSSFVTICRYI